MKYNDHRLLPCPNSPNCVSTQSSAKRHKINTIKYKITSSDVIDKLGHIIKLLKRTKIISKDENYLKVEFRSRFFKFVDDVEFCLDDKNKIVNFRYASRFGYSDLGVNRKRMEKIKILFNQI